MAKTSATELASVKNFGNNYFTLSTVIGTSSDGGETYVVKKISGVLNSLPALKWEKGLGASMGLSVTNAIADLLDSSLLTVIGEAVNYNFSIQFTGPITSQIPGIATFQSQGFTLEFDAWDKESIIYTNVAKDSISSYDDVLEYLSKTATIYSGKDDKAGREAAIADDKAKKEQKEKDKQKGEDVEKEEEEKGVINIIESIFNRLVGTQYDTNKRMLIANEKLNEPLHTLTLNLNSTLKINVIVAIKNWDFSLEDNSIGHRAKFNIECIPDQRIIADQIASDTNNPPSVSDKS